MNNETIENIGLKMRALRLPRWEELPDFGLYLDQVLTWIAQHLEGYDMNGDKMLTSSMVNNYVKLGALPPPERKKYYRPQLALLIAICVLKPVMAIAEIRDFLSAELTVEDGSRLYDSFCLQFEQANTAAVEAAVQTVQQNPEGDPLKQTIIKSALRACAERSIAQAIFSVNKGE